MTAIDISTTAIAQRRRNTNVAPTSIPISTPTATGIRASWAKPTPSTAHSIDDATASRTSSPMLRRRAHHHGPAGAPRAPAASSPVELIATSLRPGASAFPGDTAAHKRLEHQAKPPI
ncbi:hypothetical protein SVIO_066740 [Streptomyces violaceusniger]|uniref:Uncharacterized protein n=1 Tax=Streptomyces violaceusniger TaxID=68280 RepID=A0A4D4L362_STRVO|nr:hypothetical protein SVIO_066740 [Streptomyces violaceusniger]